MNLNLSNANKFSILFLTDFNHKERSAWLGRPFCDIHSCKSIRATSLLTRQAADRSSEIEDGMKLAHLFLILARAHYNTRSNCAVFETQRKIRVDLGCNEP